MNKMRLFVGATFMAIGGAGLLVFWFTAATWWQVMLVVVICSACALYSHSAFLRRKYPFLYFNSAWTKYQSLERSGHRKMAQQLLEGALEALETKPVNSTAAISLVSTRVVQVREAGDVAAEQSLLIKIIEMHAALRPRYKAQVETPKDWVDHCRNAIARLRQLAPQIEIADPNYDIGQLNDWMNYVACVFEEDFGDSVSQRAAYVRLMQESRAKDQTYALVLLLFSILELTEGHFEQGRRGAAEGLDILVEIEPGLPRLFIEFENFTQPRALTIDETYQQVDAWREWLKLENTSADLAGGLLFASGICDFEDGFADLAELKVREAVDLLADEDFSQRARRWLDRVNLG